MFLFVALLDRRWAEEKKRQIEEKQNEDLVFAEGNQIAENIGKIARKRTDIFGREETMIGLEVQWITSAVQYENKIIPHVLHIVLLDFFTNLFFFILQIGEEKKKPTTPTVQWDGHTASADVTRQQAQAKVSVREQLEHIQRVQGIL